MWLCNWRAFALPSQLFMKAKLTSLLNKESAAYTEWLNHDALDAKRSNEKFNKWLKACEQLDKFLKENNQSN